ELRRAREEVTRARDSLGDREVSVSSADERGQGDMESEAQGADGFGDFRANEAGDGEWDGLPSNAGSGQSLRGQNEGGAPAQTPATQRASVVLKPQSQLREGAVFTSQARVAPRVDKPSGKVVELDTRYSAQVEHVLSKEDYPLHRKEYVRRYFLNLSQGVPAEDATGEAEQP
ncbi:MAG: hypothetical protein ACR2RL_13200, partial [Gammaproteobacteria bacterium]